MKSKIMYKEEIDNVIEYNIQWVLLEANLENYKSYVDRAYEFVNGYVTCLMKHKLMLRRDAIYDLSSYIHERINLFDYESKLKLKSGDNVCLM